MSHNQHWVVVRETDGQETKTKHIEYTADASAFDVDSLLSETEDGLFQLMRENIAYDHLPAGDFHSRVQHLIEHDIEGLVSGIVRRLADWDHQKLPTNTPTWDRFFSLPSSMENTALLGELVAKKFGIKVTRLSSPIEHNAM